MRDEKLIEEVRKLPNYGVHITGLTKAGAKAMPKITYEVFKEKFGAIEAIKLIAKAYPKGAKIAKANPEAMEKLRGYSAHSAREFPLLIGMFLLVAEKLGSRRRAYDEVFKEIIERDATPSMADLYEVDKLEKLSDPYEAFKEYNYGLFLGEKNFPIDEFVDNGDSFSFNVTSCIQAQLAKDFGIDELGELGCDHDCAGYPTIEDRVNAVFRRPETIAKGDKHCSFKFYRKGTEPEQTRPNK